MNTGDLTSVWEQSYKLLSTMEKTKSPMAKGFLDYLVPVSLDEHQIIFATRLSHAKMWIEERYLLSIKEAVSHVLESPRDVVLIVDENIEGPLTNQQNTARHQAKQYSAEQTASVTSQTHLGSTQLQQTPPVGSAEQISSNPSLTPSHGTQQFAAVSSHPQAPSYEHNPSQTGMMPALHSATQADASAVGSGLSSLFAPDSQTQNSPPVEPDSRFTFSNYLEGESNNIAKKASIRVAEDPGLYLNPLFIHGKSGLGKTHLLMAIKNSITTYLPNKRVVYAPITEFVNDFTNAVAGDHDLDSFKHKYYACDVLLIDDVQYLEGKEGTTNALFEIFNIFIRDKKQIVLSADRHPTEINLDERFTSRFNQGIAVDIQPPNHELKAAILKNYKRYYCSYLNITEVEFSDEAVQKIIELSGSNIRELEGAISSLIFSISCKPNNQRQQPISDSEVESILGESFFHKNTNRIDMNMVMRAVESYFKVSQEELFSEKRSKNISHPRQVAMYLIRHYTDMSYPEIGDRFNKDHTTVMYADRNIQAKMVEESSVKIEVERIEEILTS